MKFSRVLTSIALAGAIAGGVPGVAKADQVDDALAKIPAGQISCEQASKYWTNTADYNNKVRKARMLAMVDSRGPQILAALQRVDEAANRCGLKNGGAQRPGAKPAPQPAPKPAAKPAPRPAQKPAPRPNPGHGHVQRPGARPAAPAPAARPTSPLGSHTNSHGAIELIPGAPVANYVMVPLVGKVAVPDLLAWVRELLTNAGIRI